MAVSVAGRTIRKLAVNSPLKRSKILCCHTTNAIPQKSLFQERFGRDASKSYTPTSPFSTSQKLLKSTPAKGTYVDLIRSQQVIKDNDEECMEVLLSPESRFLPYYKSQPLIQDGGHEPVLLKHEEIQVDFFCRQSIIFSQITLLLINLKDVNECLNTAMII